VHCGRQSYFVDATLAPSAVLEPITGNMPKEMTCEEIEDTIDSFANASQRAYKVGFDGIQFHGTHGFLLSRPLIREPDLPNKWLKGIGENTCNCISCNCCVVTVISGKVHCTQEKKD